MVPHVILVVEDDDDIRDLVVELLRDQGFAVREASDGRKALEVLNEIGDEACLVLTDRVPSPPMREYRSFCAESPTAAH